MNLEQIKTLAQPKVLSRRRGLAQERPRIVPLQTMLASQAIIAVRWNRVHCTFCERKQVDQNVNRSSRRPPQEICITKSKAHLIIQRNKWVSSRQGNTLRETKALNSPKSQICTNLNRYHYTHHRHCCSSRQRAQQRAHGLAATSSLRLSRAPEHCTLAP